jgi:hypothetical protein
LRQGKNDGLERRDGFATQKSQWLFWHRECLDERKAVLAFGHPRAQNGGATFTFMAGL